MPLRCNGVYVNMYERNLKETLAKPPLLPKSADIKAKLKPQPLCDVFKNKGKGGTELP